MADLQAKIIASTIQEISQTGIENLTTKKISQRAEISTGIIHHHFNTKSQLMLMAYKELIATFTVKREIARAKYPSNPELRIKATAMVSFDADFINDYNTRAWTQLWASAMFNQEVSKILSEYNLKLLTMIEQDFQEFCTPESARQHALSITAMISGYWVELQIAKNATVQECNDAISCCIENARRATV